MGCKQLGTRQYVDTTTINIGMFQKLLSLAACWLALALADVSHLNSDASAAILSNQFDIGPDGSYTWSFDTSNGISEKEQGQLKNAGSDNEEEVVKGSASWTAPNGEKIVLEYEADANGYRAQGSHIPTPPPIPEEIARALKHLKDNPPPAAPAH
ncbi:Larval cuticle protein LCP-17 [Eumeta japonica]|uniref:Larval cuticle protein LCP-17 n=1 Tax=Eumeta variegata TaxID=151549 RepID=A0A4C1TDK7_EUMVA|nr:Larval cuticle protein LCP-17 [Eumeta japonica]